MRNTFLLTSACLILTFCLTEKLIAQVAPEFLDCHSEPLSLCVADEGVRLPLNNKIYLGEENPDATSCSVHVSQKILVRSFCGSTLTYEVRVFLNDSTNFILQEPTEINTDSLLEAVLSFDTELSPEQLIRENGLAYNSSCDSPYIIRWIVYDSCGNAAICERQVELYDCNVPVFSNDPSDFFIVQLPVSGYLHIYAKNYISEILDDCVEEDAFLYSLKENEYVPDSVIDPCEIPAFGVELLTDFWIADSGRDVNCNDTIEWNERNIYKITVTFVYTDQLGVDCIEDFYLTGNISTEDEQTVELVEIKAQSPGHVYPTIVTGKDGDFSYSYYVGTSMTITPGRDDNHKNGVSTLDLVRIAKHLLGKEDLHSPYDVIAADANNSQSVSVIDLVELRKLVLGIYTELPYNKSWRFVPKDFIFTDTLNPWPFVESITYSAPSNGYIEFIAIKIGDVNNTVQANANSILPRTQYKPVIVTIPQENYTAGDEISIPLKIDADDLLGFQFTLTSSDLEFLSARANATDFSESNYAVFDNNMTFSWFDSEENKLNGDQIEIIIHARAKKSGVLNSLKLNSDITEAEVYDRKGNTFIPQLEINSSGHEANVYPNPWKEEANLSFQLTESANVLLEILDLNGRVIYQQEKFYLKGEVVINLNAQQVPGNGLYIYSVKTDGFSQSGKMYVEE